MPNDQMIDVLQAENRQLAYQQARSLSALVEVGRCEPFPVPGAVQRSAPTDDWAICEIAAAQTWTHFATFREHEFAERLVGRLPQVHAALRAGRIDRAKAWVFVDWLHDLAHGQIAEICAQLLPKAPRLTTGQLRGRLGRMVKSIDAAACERRYKAAVRDRAITGYLDRDGTATVRASGLTPAEAAASTERVDELARTIQRAGHPGTRQQIECDLFIALLDGSLQNMTNDQIVVAMLARADDEEIARTDGTGGADDDLDGRPGEGGGVPGSEPPPPQPEPEPAPESSSEPEPRPAAQPRAGIEVRVRLSTLLGLDEYPGEIPGWGPILPGSAREAVACQRGGEWRFAITDDDGYLILAGITRCRPTTTVIGGRVAQSRGGVVEVQVPATLLAALIADPPAGWADLIADLAAQCARREELWHALADHPDARFPHAALRRHLEIRDRTCVHPGCRRPARASQQDHTVDHKYGGLTLDENLGALCTRHHNAKTRGGWWLHQPRPGHFIWRSPLGRLYRTRGEPITPRLPGPEPGEHEPEPEPPPIRPDLDELPTFTRPAEPPPEPPPQRGPPVIDPDDDPPPF